MLLTLSEFKQINLYSPWNHQKTWWFYGEWKSNNSLKCTLCEKRNLETICYLVNVQSSHNKLKLTSINGMFKVSNKKTRFIWEMCLRLTTRTLDIIWDNVFWNGPSKICGRQLLTMWSGMVYLNRLYYLKFFKCCLPQILLGPFRNTLSNLTVFWFLYCWLIVTYSSQVSGFIVTIENVKTCKKI